MAIPTKPGREEGTDSRLPPLVWGAIPILLGLGLVWFVAKVFDLPDGTLLAIVLLLPLLVYLILTGQLTEFGAGGVTAKFRDAERRPVKDCVRPITVEEAETVEKLGREEFRRIYGLGREKPVILTLVLGGPAENQKYTQTALGQYVEELSKFPRFRFVVLLDSDGRAVAYLPAETVEGLVGTGTTAKPLVEAVNAGHLPGLAALRTEFLTPDMTVGDALQKMTDTAADAMPVRNAEGRPAGIVEREDVLARFLLDATRGD